MACEGRRGGGRGLCAEPDRPHSRFIPVLGYLDDLILVPLGIALAVRLIPPALLAEFRAEAARREALPTSRAAAAAIVALWLGAAALLLWLFWPSGAR